MNYCHPGNVRFYAKLTSMLQDVCAISSSGYQQFLGPTIVDSSQNIFLNNLKENADGEKLSEIINVLEFICELYKYDELIQESFVEALLQSLMKSKASCNITVDCINRILRSIGPKLEVSDKAMFKRFIKALTKIASNENSYRSKIYEKLIEFMKNNCKESVQPQKKGKAKNLTVFDLSVMHKTGNMKYIAGKLKQHLSASAVRMDEFIKSLLNATSTDIEVVASYAELCKELINVNASKLTFQNHLQSQIDHYLDKTRRERNVNEIIFITLLTAQLYNNDVISKEHAIKWLICKDIFQLSLHQLTHLSAIIAPKILEDDDEKLKTILTFIEITIQNATLRVLSTIHNDINDLAK
jgi:hypothetical protein